MKLFLIKTMFVFIGLIQSSLSIKKNIIKKLTKRGFGTNIVHGGCVTFE